MADMKRRIEEAERVYNRLLEQRRDRNVDYGQLNAEALRLIGELIGLLKDNNDVMGGPTP